MQNKPQQWFVPCMQPLGQVLPNRIILSKCHRSMYGVMRLPSKSPWPGCYLVHNSWPALHGTHHWVNMWLSQERKHDPSIWVPITFLALWIGWVFLWETSEEHQKAQRLSPSFPSPAPVFEDRIEDNNSRGDPLEEVGYYADTAEEQRIQPSVWRLTIGWKKTSSVTGGALQCIISTPSPLQRGYYMLWRIESWTEK